MAVYPSSFIHQYHLPYGQLADILACPGRSRPPTAVHGVHARVSHDRQQAHG